MSKKQLIIYGVVTAILAVLVYLQFRTWRNFDWAQFASELHDIEWGHIVHAVALIYLAYIVRAIRWKIFLRPVRKEASTVGMISPTLIGFTGLALLGRPGELIRPYLIARRENLSFSSQLGVWAVERIFDIGAFTLLLVLTAFLAVAPHRLVSYHAFQKAAVAFALLTIGLVIAAIAVHRRGEALASWIETKFSNHVTQLGQRLALRVREFREGLRTIDGIGSLLLLIASSVIMWCMIAVAYKEVTIAYGDRLNIPQTQVLLLMGASMVGSLVQLPGVGGGSQLATISALQHWFYVSKELAASCGIMLWLVTFVAVVPVGLFLAHRERLSLRKVAKESQQEKSSRGVAFLTARGLTCSSTPLPACYNAISNSDVLSAMKCPFCGFANDKVVDSRESKEADSIRRRRECLKCEKRFTTYERIDEIPYMVVKKDGRREKFDRQKVLNGLLRACEKRPVPIGKLEQIVNEAESFVIDSQERERKTSEVGELIMNRLRRYDKVAYVRFASVYLDFKDVKEFMAELKDLLKAKDIPEVRKGQD